MNKSRRSRKSSSFRKLDKTANKLMFKTIPGVGKGVSTVFGTLSKGLNLGVSGVKTVTNKIGITKKRGRSHRRSRRRY